MLGKPTKLGSVLIALGLAAGVFAQSPTPTPRQSVLSRENVRQSDDDDNLSDSKFGELYRDEFQQLQVSEKARKRAKLTDAEKNALREIRRDGFKTLKLFVAPACADRLVIDVSDPRCSEGYDFLQVSYYSFFYEIYGHKLGELRIVDDEFRVVLRGILQGFIVDLGEVDPRSVGRDSESVRFVADYPIARTQSDFDQQRKELEGDGISYSGRMLTTRQKLVAGHTYLLRSIQYGQSGTLVFTFDNVIVIKLERLTDDGMAIISWKKIADKKAPSLKSEK